MKKLAINCSLASSFSSFFIAIFFKSDLASKHWRFSLLTYRIDSKLAETTSWTYRLLLRHIKFSINCSITSSFILSSNRLHASRQSANHTHLSKRSRLSLSTYKSKSKYAEIAVRTSTSLSTSSSTRSWITSVLLDINDFDLKYLALVCNRQSNTDISIHIESLKNEDHKSIRMLNILLASFISALTFLTSNISQWRILLSNCKYHCSCLVRRSRTSVRNLYFYFLLFIDYWWKSHACSEICRRKRAFIIQNERNIFAYFMS